jgi:hypothetical protein
MLLLPAESARYYQERDGGRACITYGNLRGEVSRESESGELILTGRTSEGQ